MNQKKIFPTSSTNRIVFACETCHSNFLFTFRKFSSSLALSPLCSRFVNYKHVEATTKLMFSLRNERAVHHHAYRHIRWKYSRDCFLSFSFQIAIERVTRFGLYIFFPLSYKPAFIHFGRKNETSTKIALAAEKKKIKINFYWKRQSCVLCGGFVGAKVAQSIDHCVTKHVWNVVN